MADLMPTAERPGLWISAPADPRNWTGPAASPRAAFACRCGLHRQAAGQRAVAALVADYGRHQDQCPARAARPCQHCGKPTDHRSHLVQGWSAHPDCYAAWEQRPEEQRRREQRAKAIAQRERQRRQAARIRTYLQSQGFGPQVAAALVSGGLVHLDEPDP